MNPMYYSVTTDKCYKTGTHSKSKKYDLVEKMLVQD